MLFAPPREGSREGNREANEVAVRATRRSPFHSDSAYWLISRPGTEPAATNLGRPAPLVSNLYSSVRGSLAGRRGIGVPTIPPGVPAIPPGVAAMASGMGIGAICQLSYV